MRLGLRIFGVVVLICGLVSIGWGIFTFPHRPNVQTPVLSEEILENISGEFQLGADVND